MMFFLILWIFTDPLFFSATKVSCTLFFSVAELLSCQWLLSSRVTPPLTSLRITKFDREPFFLWPSATISYGQRRPNFLSLKLMAFYSLPHSLARALDGFPSPPSGLFRLSYFGYWPLGRTTPPYWSFDSNCRSFICHSSHHPYSSILGLYSLIICCSFWCWLHLIDSLDGLALSFFFSTRFRSQHCSPVG